MRKTIIIDGENFNTLEDFYNSFTDLKEYIEKNNLKIFDINPCLGLNGWVIAEELIIDVHVVKN